MQVERLLLINDFTAMALGMTRLREGEFREVCPGQADPSRPALVIGPGTGLGVGSLLRLGEQHWQALPGEGGHVDLPVGNAREAAIHQQIHGRSAMSVPRPCSVAVAWCGFTRQFVRWMATYPGTRPRRRLLTQRWAASHGAGGGRAVLSVSWARGG